MNTGSACTPLLPAGKRSHAPACNICISHQQQNSGSKYNKPPEWIQRGIGLEKFNLHWNKVKKDCCPISFFLCFECVCIE